MRVRIHIALLVLSSPLSVFGHGSLDSIVDPEIVGIEILHMNNSIIRIIRYNRNIDAAIQMPAEQALVTLELLTEKKFNRPVQIRSIGLNEIIKHSPGSTFDQTRLESELIDFKTDKTQSAVLLKLKLSANRTSLDENPLVFDCRIPVRHQNWGRPSCKPNQPQ